MPQKKLSAEVADELRSIANRLVAPGKGILAADESPVSIEARLTMAGVSNTEEMRRQYRQMMFAGECELGHYLSGVILFHETLYQNTDDGRPLKQLLRERGILAGIKVDKGLSPLALSQGETTTLGLDDLAARCKQYKADGCDFAKWRSVFKIGRCNPSRQALDANCQGLAQYASICQSERIVPIVEPEILTEGTHDLQTAKEVTECVLAHLFKAMCVHNVLLEGIILKPAMVLPGSKCPRKFTSRDVALATVNALRRTVPSAVPGVAFLSGGQDDELAIQHLNDMNIDPLDKPWRLTFCYGRALQFPALKAWAGRKEREKDGQKVFLETARKCSQASRGQYQGKGPGSSNNKCCSVQL